jgi:2-polyprenyl-6-methoxyphenol hydroxylase-like FAD-dependent oxidoreductase
MRNPSRGLDMHKKHAVILGCGYTGMLAATVLSQHFEQVSIIERYDDILNSGPEMVRMGIPQARHLHVLLQQGQLLLNQFMPGIIEEIKQFQCPEIDWAKDTKWHGPFGSYPQYLSDIKTIGFSRRILDYLMIKRIRNLANVKIIIDNVISLSCNKNPDTIDTVNLQNDTLHADLIIDTRGRRSPISTNLNELGFTTLSPLKVTNELGYASRLYQINHPHKNFKQFYLQVRPGKSKRGVVISPIENNHVFVTQIGLQQAQPSRDTHEFDLFLKNLMNEDLQNFLNCLTPASDVAICKNLHNIHFRFGEMSKWPNGFIALGDAVCVLNPVYGQGMTVAAKQVLLLQQQLTLGMTTSFQKQIDDLLKTPWAMTTAEDQRQVAAKNLPIKLRLSHRYFDEILKLAVKNPRVHTQLTRVLHMMDKPDVFYKSGIMMRVLLHFVMPALFSSVR